MVLARLELTSLAQLDFSQVEWFDGSGWSDSDHAKALWKPGMEVAQKLSERTCPKALCLSQGTSEGTLSKHPLLGYYVITLDFDATGTSPFI